MSKESKLQKKEAAKAPHQYGLSSTHLSVKRTPRPDIWALYSSNYASLSPHNVYALMRPQRTSAHSPFWIKDRKEDPNKKKKKNNNNNNNNKKPESRMLIKNL